MSKFSKHQIPCPSCGHTGEFTRWDSINVNLDPQMREEAISGRIFRWTCPHCGETFTVPYPTLYHDMKRDFMIWYMPVRPSDGDGLRFRGANGPYKQFEGYRYRSTFEIHDFQEKICQLESGLDDCAIEMMKKVMLYSKLPDGLPADTEFRFGGVFQDGESERYLLFHCVSDHLDEDRVVKLPYSTYEDMAKESMLHKLFEQDAEFPEVTQAFLKRLLKE